MPKTEVDPTTYLEKPPTSLQARFGDYIKDEVGYDPAAAKTKEQAFRDGVRLATSLRMVFQASAFNREARKEEQSERASAAPAPRAKAAPKAKPTPAETATPAVAKKAGKKAAAPVPTAEEQTEEEEVQAAPTAKRAARRAPARRSAPAANAGAAPF